MENWTFFISVFSAEMIQTNLTTKSKCKVRRVMLPSPWFFIVLQSLQCFNWNAALTSSWSWGGGVVSGVFYLPYKLDRCCCLLLLFYLPCSQTCSKLYNIYSSWSFICTFLRHQSKLLLPCCCCRVIGSLDICVTKWLVHFVWCCFYICIIITCKYC